MSSISHRPECHVVVTIISLCKVFCKLLRPGFATKSLIAVVVSVSAEVVGKRNTIVLIISRHEDVSFRSICTAIQISSLRTSLDDYDSAFPAYQSTYYIDYNSQVYSTTHSPCSHHS